MNCQFRIFRHASGIWYIENTATRQQESLRTKFESEAKRFFNARNEAVQQPAIKLQIAHAYLSAADPSSVSRTWQLVMDEMAKSKKRPTKDRRVRSVAQRPFDHIRNLKLVERRIVVSERSNQPVASERKPARIDPKTGTIFVETVPVVRRCLKCSARPSHLKL